MRDSEGVSFLTHPRIQSIMHNHVTLRPHITVLHIRMEERTTNTMVRRYAPNYIASEEDKDWFFSDLDAADKNDMSSHKYTCSNFYALVGNVTEFGEWVDKGEHRNDNIFRLLCPHATSYMQTPFYDARTQTIDLKRPKWVDKFIKSYITPSKIGHGA